MAEFGSLAVKVSEIPSVQRGVGVIEIPETKLPTKAQGITIAIENVGLPEGPVAEIQIEGSADNGKTWDFLGGATLDGGAALGRDGKPRTESSYTVQFTQADEIIEFPDTYLVRGQAKLLQPLKAGVQIRIF